MNQLTVVPPSGLGPAHDGSQDAKLVELWLSMKTSRHTRRAYAAEAARFLAFVAQAAILGDADRSAGLGRAIWGREVSSPPARTGPSPRSSRCSPSPRRPAICPSTSAPPSNCGPTATAWRSAFSKRAKWPD